MPDNVKATQVRITGRVQGVGFRDWTWRESVGLGLAGWVRNEADGSVVAVLVGDEAAVASMVDRLHQGPPFSRVTAVSSESTTLEARPANFRIIR